MGYPNGPSGHRNDHDDCRAATAAAAASAAAASSLTPACLSRITSEIEQALLVVNNPLSQPRESRFAQNYLVALQAQPQSCGIVLNILSQFSTKSARQAHAVRAGSHLLFYAAQTVQIKMKNELSSYPQASQVQICNSILSIVSNLSSMAAPPQVVVRKLCASLCSYAVNSFDCAESIKQIVSSIDAQIQGSLSDNTNSAAINLSACLIDFLSLLPLELEAPCGDRAQHLRLHTALSASSTYVLAIVSSFLSLVPASQSMFQNDPQILSLFLVSPEFLNTLSKCNVDLLSGLQLECLKCVVGWIRFLTVEMEAVFSVYNNGAMYFHRTSQFPFSSKVFSYAVASLEYLTETLSAFSRYEDSFCRGILLPFLMQCIIPRLHAVAECRDISPNSDESERADVVKALSQFLCAAVEAYSSWFVANAYDSSVSGVLCEMPKIILAYAAPFGYPGAEQQISELPFHALRTIQEYYSEAAAKESVQSGSIASGNTAQSAQTAKTIFDSKNALSAIYGDVAMAVINTIISPPDSLISKWSSEQRKDWEIFRAHSEECFQLVYYVCGKSFWEILVQQLLSSSDYPTLESLLLAMSALSEVIDENQEIVKSIAGFFGNDGIICNFAKNGVLSCHPPRFRRAILTLIAKYAKLISTALPDASSLGPTMGIVLNSLQDTDVLQFSVKALRAFCLNNRSATAYYIPNIMDIFLANKNNFALADKQKLIEAVGMILTCVSEETVPKILQAILQDVLWNINRTVNLLHDMLSLAMDNNCPEYVEAKGTLLDNISMIHSLCVGLWSSEDGDQGINNDEESPDSAKSTSFESDGLSPRDGTVSRPKSSDVLGLIMLVCEQVLRFQGSSKDLLVLEGIIELIIRCFESDSKLVHSHPKEWCQLMRWLAVQKSGLLSYKVSDLAGSWCANIRRFKARYPESSVEECEDVLSQVLLSILSGLRTCDKPAIVHNVDFFCAYFHASGSVMKYLPRTLHHGTLLLESTTLAITCLTMSEPQLIKSSAYFLKSYIGLHNPDCAPASLNEIRMRLLPGLVEAILSGLLLSGLPSVAPLLADLLFKLTTASDVPARDLLNSILLGPNKSVILHGLSDSDIGMVIRQILTIRQLKRFKEFCFQLRHRIRGGSSLGGTPSLKSSSSSVPTEFNDDGNFSTIAEACHGNISEGAYFEKATRGSSNVLGDGSQSTLIGNTIILD